MVSVFVTSHTEDVRCDMMYDLEKRVKREEVPSVKRRPVPKRDKTKNSKNRVYEWRHRGTLEENGTQR